MKCLRFGYDTDLATLCTQTQKIVSHFSKLVPHIFPFGMTKDILGTATVMKQLRENWLLFYDQRCAEEINLIFLLFNQLKRHKANSAVAFKIKTAGKIEQEFINQVNEPSFKDSINEAIKNPNTSESRSLKKTLEPLVKITGKNVPWSTYERNDTLGKLYSLTHFFGIGTHFITISPSMRNNILALRLSIANHAQSFDIPNIIIRSKLMIQNSVAATHVFYRLLHKFFEIIVQMPLTDYTGRTSNVKNLLSRVKNEKCGAFGQVKSAYGVLEEQACGNLHFHGILFGAWKIRQIQQWIHASLF